MRSLECIPCLLGQALNMVRSTGADNEATRKVLSRALSEVGSIMDGDTAPEICTRIYEELVAATGIKDPFVEFKKASTEAALRLLPRMRELVEKAEDPFEKALEISLAGNVIDLAIMTPEDLPEIVNLLEKFEGEGFAIDDSAELWSEIACAETVLFIGDNAGEAVFDRLLLESLDNPRVYFAVRGGPALNDVTYEDGVASGISKPVEIVSTGYPAPGVILEKSSESFRKLFQKADLVLAKGQGNYETLLNPPRPVFHLFKVKCNAVAENVGCEEGSYVVWKNKGIKGR